MYPSFKSVFHSTLLTEAQYTVAKALDALQERSPANGRVVSRALPHLRAVQDDKDGLALATRDLFIALEPRDDPAAAEVHWHECAEVMARLDQDFTRPSDEPPRRCSIAGCWRRSLGNQAGKARQPSRTSS